MRHLLHILRSLVLVFIILTFAPPSFSQNLGRLTGIVVDANTRQPLPGVNIMVTKTLMGTATDDSGRFVIWQIPSGVYTLRVSMMGYETRSMAGVTITPGQSTALNIRLEPTVIRFDPIVVTASKHPQSLGTSHQAVTVIDRLHMAQRQSFRLEESLNPVSGVHFNEENISIRGSSGYSVYNVGSRILLMVDGVPVLTPDLATIHWKMIPLLDIDHVEVVKGAGSALYGSSAMGGVVNIITRDPGPKARFQVRTLAGVYDRPHYEIWRWTNETLHYEQADLAYSQRFGSVGVQLGFSRYVSTGYMENNAFDKWNASAKFRIRLPRQSRLDIYTSWMKTRQGFLIQWLNQNSPFQVPPFNQEDELRYDIINFYAQYHLPVSSRLNLRFRLSHLFSEMGTQYSVNAPDMWKPGNGLGWEVQGDWIPGPLHHLTFGTELRWDVSGSRYFGDHKGYTVSPYIQEEWTLLTNLSTTLGLRFDHHVLIDEETDSRLSPKLGINYRPFDGTTIRATAGSGFRAATVFEKHLEADYSGLNAIPNPELRPERSWFYDLGIRQSITRNGHIELSLFQADYWDMIEPVINFLGAIQFQNYIRARIRGLECAAQVCLWHRRFELSGSLTWLDPMDLHRDLTLPYRPRLTYDLMSTLRLGPASFQVEYRYASRIDEVQLNPLDTRVPIKLLYLRAQVTFWNLTLQLAVNNALNYHYTHVERRMGEIRNATVGLLMDVGNR